MKSPMVHPNPTLYVSNLDWKIKKPLLRRALYSLFTRHGKVLEIITLRRDGLRGQAWVVMEDVPAATAALQAEQGTIFFGKDIQLAYAKQVSDRIAKRDGTYVPKAKRKKVDPSNGTTNIHAESNINTTPPPPPPPSTSDDNHNDDNHVTSNPSSSSSPSSSPPSHILLAQGLPSDVTSEMLQLLFQQYHGFQEVRMPRTGDNTNNNIVAFIEFQQEPQATMAMTGLQGFQLSQNATLKLEYGKV